MVDKITTVPRAKVRTRVGRLADEDMIRLNRAIVVFLGIAAPANKSRLLVPPAPVLIRQTQAKPLASG
jgi:mRNA interferase MazF